MKNLNLTGNEFTADVGLDRFPLVRNNIMREDLDAVIEHLIRSLPTVLTYEPSKLNGPNS